MGSQQLLNVSGWRMKTRVGCVLEHLHHVEMLSDILCACCQSPFTVTHSKHTAEAFFDDASLSPEFGAQSQPIHCPTMKKYLVPDLPPEPRHSSQRFLFGLGNSTK